MSWIKSSINHGLMVADVIGKKPHYPWTKMLNNNEDNYNDVHNDYCDDDDE